MNLQNAKIAWVTPILGRGGKLFYMGPLLEALAGQCGKLRIYTAEFGTTNMDSRLDIHENGRVHRFYYRGRDGYEKGFTVIGPGLISALRKDRPDYVFVNEFSLMSLYAVIARMLGLYKKMILVIENRPVPNDKGITLAIKKIFRRFIARRADAILTNNTNGRDYAIDELRVDSGRIVAKPYLVSHMSIPDARITEAARRFTGLQPGDAINLLYVGRLIEQKGFQHLISALEKLASTGHTNFILHAVGEGDYRDTLEAQIAAAGLASKVVFHGQCDYKSLVDFYLSAHVFIFPSLRDYRALAPFEAISAGLPIISSIHDGGSVESAKDQVNGFRIDPCDHESFVAAIETILSRPEKLAGYSRQSLRIASAYTLENAVAAMQEAASIATGAPSASE